MFGDVFLCISVKCGANTAYTAVVRKMLTVIWHLLVCDELYVLEGFSKKPVLLRRGRWWLGFHWMRWWGFCVRLGYGVGCFAKG